ALFSLCKCSRIADVCMGNSLFDASHAAPAFHPTVSWMSSRAGNHQSLRYLRRDDSDRAVVPFFAGPLLRVEEPFVVTPSGVRGRQQPSNLLPAPERLTASLRT